MDVIDYVPPSESTTDPNDDPDGQTDGNPGYAADGSNMDTLADAMGKIFGLTDFADHLDNLGGINSGEVEGEDNEWGDDTDFM